MNRISALLAGAAFVATVPSAMAADAIICEPTPSAPIAAVYDWTGFYLGANGGYVSTRAELGGASEKFNGGALGAHVGYNFQNSAWVFGAEADVAYTWNENVISAALSRSALTGSGLFAIAMATLSTVR